MNNLVYKKACPVTCYTFGDDCEQGDDAIFLFNITNNGNGVIYKKCGWSKKKKTNAVNNICTKRTVSYDGIGPSAEVCPVTCAACSS